MLLESRTGHKGQLSKFTVTGGGGRGYRQFMPCAFKIIFLFPKSSANLLISFVKDPILLLCLIKLFFNKQCPKIEIINAS